MPYWEGLILTWDAWDEILYSRVRGLAFEIAAFGDGGWDN
jgi:hypothetical protein